MLSWIGYVDDLELKNKFTYIINGFCMGLVLAFLPFYVFVIRSLVVSVASLACLGILVVAMFFLKTRKFLTAKAFMLFGFFYQVSALALLWFPREANFNYFYFIVAPIVFFILDFRNLPERILIIVSCAIAVILLVFSEVTAFPAPVIPLTGKQTVLLSAMSVISTIGSMSLVFYFYASNLAAIHGELNVLASTDPLTGVYNRRTLDREGKALISRTMRTNGQLCLTLMDIDHFKKVNDAWGHPTGDAVLKEFADLISGNIRKNDLLFRYGGEEFALILQGTGHEAGLTVAENLRKAIMDHEFESSDGTSLKVTASFGIAIYRRDFMEFETLMEAADSALYRAKENGRNRVEIHDDAAD